MGDSLKVLIGLVGAVITLSAFVITVAFKMGHHSARIESLEQWRANVRLDMHEISEKLDAMSQQMTALATLIQERTERRMSDRNDGH